MVLHCIRRFFVVAINQMKNVLWPLYLGAFDDVRAVTETYQQLSHGIELYQAFLRDSYPLNK